MCEECQDLYALKSSSSQSEAREVSLAMHGLRLGSDELSSEQPSPREHAKVQRLHCLMTVIESFQREIQEKEQKVANLKNELTRYALEAANLGIKQAI